MNTVQIEREKIDSLLMIYRNTLGIHYLEPNNNSADIESVCLGRVLELLGLTEEKQAIEHRAILDFMTIHIAGVTQNMSRIALIKFQKELVKFTSVYANQT